MSETVNWQNGLLNCYNDGTICCLSFLCPCYMSGLIAETTSRNCLLYTLLSSVPCFHVFFEYIVRDDIRVRKGIQGTPLDDMLALIFCNPCALAQEGAEVKDQIVSQLLSSTQTTTK